MKGFRIVTLGILTLVATPLAAQQQAYYGHRQDRTLEARLNGYEENPTLSTTGRGEFKARITRNNEIHYELKYWNLESDITQSHIHFGRPHVNGGISVWLCGTNFTTPPLPGPAGTPACELGTSGSVEGTITAESVIGPAGQGIDPGQFEELLAAIRSDSTYVNVHTVNRGGGEIRGIIK